MTTTPQVPQQGEEGADRPASLGQNQGPRLHLTHSPTIGKIAGALAKAQGAFETLTKDAENPFFKSSYADLGGVIASTRKALADNELAFIQSPGNVSGKLLSLTSLLVHASGEWFRGELEMPIAQATAQGVGSSITYARRYAEQAMLNVAAVDDDGEAAVGREATRPLETNEQFDQRTDSQRFIAQPFVNAFWEAAKKTGKTNDQVSAFLKTLGGIVQVEHITKGDWNAAIKWATQPLRVPQDLTQPLQASVDMANEKKANAALQKRFAAVFAAAGEKGIPVDDVKRWAYETFNVSSMKELTEDQVKGVLEWIKSM